MKAVGESLSLILVHTFSCHPRPVLLFSESRRTYPECMRSGASHREAIVQLQVLINLVERLPKHTLWRGHGQTGNHWITYQLTIVAFGKCLF